MGFNIEGRGFTARGLGRVRLGVEDGRFVEAAKRWPTRMYARGLLLPGFIDPHVHLRDPGFPAKEDASTGTEALARGGVVLAIDMPNTSPPTTDAASFEAKARIFEAKARIDLGIAILLTPEARLVPGAAAYKLYAGHTTGADAVPPPSWPAAVARVARHRPVFVHAEHPDLLGRPGADLRGHNKARPAKAETAVVEALSGLGARFHLCHASSPSALMAAKRLGWSVEATLHHLLLDTHRAAKLGARAKVNPPLRAPQTRLRLQQAFRDGFVDALGSDHAPHTIAEKRRPFRDAPSGAPNGEVQAPVALALALRDRLPLDRVVHALSTGPAAVLGVSRGRLRQGIAADWVHVPPASAIRPVEAADLNTRAGWCLFEGWPALFPDEVWCRGEQVVAEGAVLDTRGRVERFEAPRTEA